MAEASELGTASSLEEELLCPICLDVYRNPVSLSCGHSFCKDCVQKALSAQQSQEGSCHCPLCQAQLEPSPELQTNFQLCSIGGKLLGAPKKKGTSQEEEAPPQPEEIAGGDTPQEDETVVCDFCLEQSQPAVKTCLNCEASLCQAHLSKHNARATQSNHVLVEPSAGKSLEERKCLEHSKLVECYCVDDLACICVLCYIAGSHKGHNIITLKEAWDKELGVLHQTVKELQTSESELNKSLENLLENEEKVKADEKMLRDQLLKLLKEVHSQVDQKQREILEAIKSSTEEQLSEIQKRKQATELKRDEAGKIVQELQASKRQRDAFLFLKTFKVAQDRLRQRDFKVDDMKMPAPVVQLDCLTVENILKKSQQFISDVHTWMQVSYNHNHLTFQTEDNNPNLMITNNLQTLSISVRRGLGPYHVPNMFPMALSSQAFSAGWHFWEVDTSSGVCWSLGVTTCSSLRNKTNMYNYYLQKEGSWLSVFENGTVTIKQEWEKVVRVVRVELDCEKNMMSFYASDHMPPEKEPTLIKTLSVYLKSPFYAGFCLLQGSLTLL
ncbi:PREDICTED: E3 ubiquitin-protein ligase TRIM17-like [Gavialis gangeticus]|uniref:E3 ubiquitin-protein ligase TRIM17-like n=1 Tax=Gavialis gangeticus TaxID=94835 RepID=UPI00092F11EA|nr:PREDICTED: E3 ubiquitin-protein ligase TRIM17-like [Gavialis gangeticus]